MCRSELRLTQLYKYDRVAWPTANRRSCNAIAFGAAEAFGHAARTPIALVW
ncbi:MAG: hypothetical protein F6J98_42320 [Moorea sp. SIO4G2]|nr:hypothetical protein [Moorena sp. SIO4G2]